MTVGAYIPADVVASASAALLVAIIFLARQHARLAERVARLEGRAERNGRK